MRRPVLRALAAAALLGACATAAPAPRVAAQDTAIVALRDEPETLFAPGAASTEALTVLGAMTEGLVVENENGDLEPRLAERVPTFENGDASMVTQEGTSVLTVRFRLRDAARWQDGTPVRPADIRFGWQLLSNPETKVAQYSVAQRLKDVRALDDRTVEAVYRPGELDPRYALCCNAFVLPEAQLRDVPPAKLGDSAFARQPMYAGPFAFKERQGNTSLTLERSPSYALGPAKLRSIVFLFRSDPNALLQDLSSHRVDLATGVYGVESAGALSAIEPRGVRALFTPTLAAEHVDFNLRDPKNLAKPHPILGARDVRVALALAIDRDKLARTATAGRAPVPLSYVPAPSWGAPSSDVTTYGYDPAAAERMLTASGWVPGPDGVRVREGVRMQLRLTVAAGNALRDQTARQIADALKKVGAAVTIEDAVMGSMTAPRGPLATGQFDLALYAWVGDRDPYGWSLLYQRGQIPTAANGFSGQNFPGWNDERFSALADEAARFIEPDARRTRYAEMNRIWTTALPALPLYQRVSVDVADVRFRELRPQPTRRPITWNAALWSFVGA
ncbi:MAG TPA: peptide ABC transporter substrate-binding protein [Candidatus Dormibacteraeota bacterium]|nr:peptide ABC transporter substrate-binding protein [Candidatus Dormibacteraeota bacterium]